MVRADTGASYIQTTRTMLEAAVRARVANYPGVRLMPKTAAIGPVFEDGRVTGVNVSRDGTTSCSPPTS